MTITTPPPPAPQLSDPANFPAKADAFAAWLVQFQADLETYNAGFSPLGRNMLINGAFQIDQRSGGTLTNTNDDQYSHDRWNILTQTASVQTSQLTDPENGYTHAMRITQNQAAAQRFGVSQIVEGINCKFARGGSVALHGRARCSASTNLKYAILGWTSTVDIVTSDVVASWTSGTYTAGNFFLASNLTVIAVGTQAVVAGTWTPLPLLTAAAGTTFNNLIAFVWTETTQVQNVTLDFDYLQLEAGAAANPFERRNVGTELVNCLRYTWVYNSDIPSNFNILGTFMGNTNLQAQAWNTFPIPMRTAPSVTSGGTALRVGALPGGAITGGVTITVDSGTSRTCLSLTTSPVGGGAAVYGQLYAGDTTTRCTFSAEL